MKAKDVPIGEDFIWTGTRYTRVNYLPESPYSEVICAVSENHDVFFLCERYEVEPAEPKQFRLWLKCVWPLEFWFPDSRLFTYDDAAAFSNK